MVTPRVVSSYDHTLSSAQTVQHSAAVHGFAAHATSRGDGCSAAFPSAGQLKSSAAPSPFVSAQVLGTGSVQSRGVSVLGQETRHASYAVTLAPLASGPTAHDSSQLAPP